MAAVISAVPQIPAIAPSRMRLMNYRRRCHGVGSSAEYGPDHPSGALDRAHRAAVQMIDDHARPSPRFHFALAATEQVAAGSARSGCAARAAANIAGRTLTRPGVVAKMIGRSPIMLHGTAACRRRCCSRITTDRRSSGTRGHPTNPPRRTRSRKRPLIQIADLGRSRRVTLERGGNSCHYIIGTSPRIRRCW
jgi:hypothetical protein